MEEPKDNWAWVDISFVEWRKATDERMFEVYAITIDDSGVDDEYLMPHEFIEWFGMKYDLTPRSDIEWGELGANL